MMGITIDVFKNYIDTYKKILIICLWIKREYCDTFTHYSQYTEIQLENIIRNTI